MMSTSMSSDPALHGYKASDALQVLDLILHHQMGTFSAVEITQVAELLPSWIPHNVVAITNARVDDRRDWYFPVFTGRAPFTSRHAHQASLASSWSGIHHTAEHHASPALHLLPTLPELPPPWKVSTIVSCVGGLLLLMPPKHPLPSSERRDRAPWRGALWDGRCLHCERVGGRHARACGARILNIRLGIPASRCRGARHSEIPQRWLPLLVCNPLTKTWRELPEVNWDFLSWGYDEVQIDMIVDESANSYTIVMTFRSSGHMCVYKSTSNSWACHRDPPLARRGMAWMSHACASAVVCGRLHYAFLEYSIHASALASLRVFEFQVETGEWKPWREYGLRTRTWGVLVTPFVHLVQGRTARGAFEVLRGLGLVECMRDMYAVIPTRLDEIVISRNAVRSRALEDAYRSQDERCEAMPIQFQILGLSCETRPAVNGVLRIQVPHDTSDLHVRKVTLLEKTSTECSASRRWFSCTARGSVIWVACEDYLLQYDVMSGQSQTRIVRKQRLVDAGVSYRPSFHMKP